MPDLSTLAEARSRWVPPWANEPHPAFCASPDGCDGHHQSEIVEVRTGVVGWLHVYADLDRTGRCTVQVAPDDPDAGVLRKLTPDAARELGMALINAAHVARTQARMAPSPASYAASFAAA